MMLLNSTLNNLDGKCLSRNSTAMNIGIGIQIFSKDVVLLTNISMHAPIGIVEPCTIEWVALDCVIKNVIRLIDQ